MEYNGKGLDIGKALGAPATELEGLSTGNAWVRVMHNGQPHRALLIETDKVELKTGWLEPIRCKAETRIRQWRQSTSKQRIKRGKQQASPDRRAR